ncbi:16S rRNA (uracil(1498)-N(3))-methyltransferase [Defluviimonas sp. WL0002]|uniref:Ribosomal RNA small subunit methyltransferase E n=1 Tax=Albidovulum marisflavi TaxID=2984159 RepID=A0ABT2Z7W4_9RHOB|nr:16S rRNA (uracil(1498)-N(3))-methyltransferase [Defluviimonas sp. WL0002]MCV2867191.1 16S rRNA (uracil(1498)-N(3))-methyltransferase [Defluviimonas sp. WL0002]
MSSAKIRLCVDHPLGPGQSVPLDEAQAHYLFGVMRQGVGGQVLVFNGRDGEWLAEVAEAGKRKGALSCMAQTAAQTQAPDLWLLFAPVKKARTDFIVEKAVELGAARIVPVATDFTNAERLRRDKAEAHVREAAEQCGALHLPEVDDIAPLAKVLARWDPARRILWADEDAAGRSSALQALLNEMPGPWAILIGPEGGFSGAERTRLRALPFVRPVPLGPRILRAETAALAALVLWQAALGDWRQE